MATTTKKDNMPAEDTSEAPCPSSGFIDMSDCDAVVHISLASFPSCGNNGKEEATDSCLSAEPSTSSLCAEDSDASDDDSVASGLASSRTSICSTESVGSDVGDVEGERAEVGSWGAVDPKFVMPPPLGAPTVVLEATHRGMMDGSHQLVPYLSKGLFPGAVWGDQVVYRIKVVEGRPMFELAEHVWVSACAADDMRISTTYEVLAAIRKAADAW